MARKMTEKSETKRLTEIYKDLPENQFAVVQGLIVQAARLRVQLNELYKDIEEHGRTEQFQQSDKVEPYERERPAAALFIKLDKNYQAVIKQLNDLTPAKKTKSKLEQLKQDG